MRPRAGESPCRWRPPRGRSDRGSWPRTSRRPTRTDGRLHPCRRGPFGTQGGLRVARPNPPRSEEHTSELQSRGHIVCRLLLEKNKNHYSIIYYLNTIQILKHII